MRRDAYTVAELLVCAALGLAVAAAGSPALLAARDTARAAGAADYLIGRLHGARMEALRRGRNVAVRFEQDADTWRLAVYADGNGNGVRSEDITTGVDPLMQPAERLADQFAGVSFGLEDGVPTVDPDDAAESRDPIRVGRSRMISFSPTGTSSTGTVYIRGQGRHQLAVRVLGTTGRVRSLSYDFWTLQWQGR
jgi:hypothetical protein